MKPINFKEANVLYAKNQDGYKPLHAFESKSNIVTSLWHLSLLERLKLLFIGKIWISQMTFGKPLQPIKPEIQIKAPIEK